MQCSNFRSKLAFFWFYFLSSLHYSLVFATKLQNNTNLLRKINPCDRVLHSLNLSTKTLKKSVAFQVKNLFPLMTFNQYDT